MSPQISCTRGCIVTLIAFVWLFSTVCFQMRSQVACIRRWIVTLIAFAWLFSNVHFQMACMRWCIITLVALVWLFTTVYFHMYPQTGCIRRCIVTSIAFVWLFSTVYSKGLLNEKHLDQKFKIYWISWFSRISREISLLDLDLEAFSFHFSFSISILSHFHFTFHSRSRLQGFFISLFILEMSEPDFHFTFHFSKWVNQIFISLFNSRTSNIHSRRTLVGGLIWPIPRVLGQFVNFRLCVGGGWKTNFENLIEMSYSLLSSGEDGHMRIYIMGRAVTGIGEVILSRPFASNWADILPLRNPLRLWKPL